MAKPAPSAQSCDAADRGSARARITRPSARPSTRARPVSYRRSIMVRLPMNGRCQSHQVDELDDGDVTCAIDSHVNRSLEVENAFAGDFDPIAPVDTKQLSTACRDLARA